MCSNNFYYIRLDHIGSALYNLAWDGFHAPEQSPGRPFGIYLQAAKKAGGRINATSGRNDNRSEIILRGCSLKARQYRSLG